MDDADVTDPWTISAEDRAKYETQFLQLNPVNGMIIGEKVKPILMKSGLPTAVLGHIWGLADINGDGKLDKKEFSIAVHLIRKKLQGSDLPKTLPASLKADPSTPAQVTKPLIQSTTTVPPTKSITSPPGQVRATTRPAAAVPVKPGIVVPAPPSVAVAPSPSKPSTAPPVTSSAKPASDVSNSPPSAAANSSAGIPSTKTSSTATSGVRSGDVSQWTAIPAAELTKYQQLFTVKDRAKRGYLTGLEAKAILSQSGLPVKVLAQIWNLADIDDDGRLVLEEFQVAMHFVAVAKSGKPVPNTLPPEYIPPSYRKAKTSDGAACKSSGVLPKVIPPLQPPVGSSKKVADKSPRIAAVAATTVSAATVQAPPMASPVVVAAPKPSVDLLLLDDPFGMPPSELPVPLLEQVLAKPGGDSQKKTSDDATPPDVLSSCSVVWNSGAPVDTSESVDEELKDEKPLEGSSPLKSEEGAISPLPDVTSVAKQEEGAAIEVETGDRYVPTSVPELHVTTVEDAPEEDEDQVDVVENVEDDAIELSKEKEREKREKEEAELLEAQRKAEEEERLEKERKLKLEKDLQELERLRQVELENQRQLELEKQKQQELERQKRLEEERKRRVELEKMRQLELERQKQLEKDKEEQRKKAQEQKEVMQRELQKQRQLDWEHQRRDQLIVLKARCQNIQDQMEKEIVQLKKDLTVANKKKSDIQSKIEKSRTVVGEFTSAIEGMRQIRDEKLAEISSVQLKIEESKRKLKVSQQERHLLDTQLLSCDQHLNDTYKVILKSCSKKKTTVDNLNEQLSSIEKETAKKLELIESNNAKLTTLKVRMNALHSEVKLMQHALVSKKQLWDTKNQFGEADGDKENKQRKKKKVPTATLR